MKRASQFVCVNCCWCCCSGNIMRMYNHMLILFSWRPFLFYFFTIFHPHTHYAINQYLQFGVNKKHVYFTQTLITNYYWFSFSFFNMFVFACNTRKICKNKCKREWKREIKTTLSTVWHLNAVSNHGFE